MEALAKKINRRTMTVPEFAETYGIPVSTVRWWIQHDQGPRSAKVGRQRLFHCDEVARWEADTFAGAGASK